MTSTTVIPSKAGIHVCFQDRGRLGIETWGPAFAGATDVSNACPQSVAAACSRDAPSAPRRRLADHRRRLVGVGVPGSGRATLCE